MANDFMNYFKKKFEAVQETLSSYAENTKKYLTTSPRINDMKEKLTHYADKASPFFEKVEQLVAPVIKNMRTAFKKPAVKAITLAALCLCLTGCGAQPLPQDRELTADELKGIPSEVDQEALDRNRRIGALLGLDRGNIIPQQEETLPPQKTEPTETIPPETTPETTTPQETVPNEPSTEPSMPTPSQEGIDILNSFNEFAQTYHHFITLSQGEEPNYTDIIFDSISPVEITVGDHQYQTPFYAVQNSYKPGLQPDVTFEHPVYAFQMNIMVDGKPYSYVLYAEPEAFENVMTTLGGTPREITNADIQNGTEIDLIGAETFNKAVGKRGLFPPPVLGPDAIPYWSEMGGNNSHLTDFLGSMQRCNASFDFENVSEMGG